MITHESPKGYLEAIRSTRMEGKEVDEEMSDHQRWLVQQKIIVLTLALVQAKNKMETFKNWDTCCEVAINHQARVLGLRAALNNYKTDDETSAVPVKIEALAKQFKTHHCALDFDHAFIKAVL